MTNRGSLASVLAGSGYRDRRDQIEQQQSVLRSRELNQAGQLMGLQQALQQQEAFKQKQAQEAEALNRQNQFRSELAALGPNPTQEQLATVGAKYSDPKTLLTTQQASLDRQQVARNSAAQMAATQEAARARLEQNARFSELTHQWRMGQAKTDQEKAAETARHNKVIEGIQSQLAAIKAETGGQSKPPSGYKWSETQPGTLEPIPGGPAGKLSSDAAGRAAMMDQAVKDLDFVESKLFKKDGSLDKTLVAGINVPGFSGLPGYTDARKTYSAIENAIAAKLRIETGAATNPDEIINTANRFKPTIMDTADSARDKVRRLREAMKMGLEQMHVAGYVSDETYRKAKAAQGSAPTSVVPQPPSGFKLDN